MIKRFEDVQIKEREAMRLESRIKKEKQFNRKVELNRKLNDLKKEIEELKR